MHPFMHPFFQSCTEVRNCTRKKKKNNKYSFRFFTYFELQKSNSKSGLRYRFFFFLFLTGKNYKNLDFFIRLLQKLWPTKKERYESFLRCPNKFLSSIDTPRNRNSKDLGACTACSRLFKNLNWVEGTFLCNCTFIYKRICKGFKSNNMHSRITYVY